MPSWVVLLAFLLAALTWQMRFLPALLMVALAIVGLTVRARYARNTRRVRAACVVLPCAAAAAAYVCLGPAIADAFAQGEVVTALLLLVPPGLAPLLTGPVPAGVARMVTHWPALAAAVLAPFLIGAIFLLRKGLLYRTTRLRSEHGYEQPQRHARPRRSRIPQGQAGRRALLLA